MRFPSTVYANATLIGEAGKNNTVIRRVCRITTNITYKEVKIMLIYDKLNYLDEEENAYGVNPLSYVVLGCSH